MKTTVRVVPVDPSEELIARALHAVQMRAYAQEAALLGVRHFPPLSVTVEDLRTCAEDFLAAYLDDSLAAAVSLRPDPEGMGTNIASLVVDPPFQRRGLARLLLTEVQRQKGHDVLTVQTGAKNLPALALYAVFGFLEIRRWQVGPESLELVKLRRIPG